jgi:hypothetical protein
VTVPGADAVTAPPPLVIRQQLSDQFPAFDISTYRDELSRPVFVAKAKQFGTRPHLFSSTDPARMRAALGAGE